MQPVIPDIGSLGSLVGFDPIIALIAIGGSFVLSMVIAWVYKATHRGLSYSQSFHFALVLLCMLGSVVMMVATGSLLRAIGILGAFSLIRFRTAIKDPKDMAYILLVLAVGLSMGAQMYALAAITTFFVSLVILLLTFTNFGAVTRHESVIRLVCKESNTSTLTASCEALLEKMTDAYHLLSARSHSGRLELSYGVRPKRGSTTASLIEEFQKEKEIEHVEIFDAKHQLEF
jgi:uncharacterized membrane protein YhiD involved in acid resistance